MRHVGRGIRAVGLALMVMGIPVMCAAAETADEPPPSPAQLEATIRDLKHPIDHERLTRLFVDLGRVADPAEQQRLQQLLDERMRELITPPPTSPEEAASSPPEEKPHEPATFGSESADDEFQQRLKALHLGPDATADDLRQRDELISAIIGIRDPARRERYLLELEQLERNAETAVYRPKPREDSPQ